MDQTEGIPILQIGHDPRRRLRVVSQMLLNLNAPGRIELIIHIGQKVGFGDGVRHRILLRYAGLDACFESAPTPRSLTRNLARRHVHGPAGT